MNPDGLIQLAALIVSKVPHAALAGIEGDANHTWGYHKSPDYILHDPNSEYGASDMSIQAATDKPAFNPQDAAAIDISYPSAPATIRTVTARLRAAVHAKDPRLFFQGEWVLAEFAGTLDGSVTFAIYTVNGAEDFGGWDDSHLSHNHASIHRKFCNNLTALRGLADVMAGIPLEEATTTQEDGMAQYKAYRSDKNHGGNGAVYLAAPGRWQHADTDDWAVALKDGIVEKNSAGKVVLTDLPPALLSKRRHLYLGSNA